MKNWFLYFVLFVCHVQLVKAQSNLLFEEGKSLERQYNTNDAIKKYEEALIFPGIHLPILVRLVELNCYTIDDQKEEADKRIQLDKIKEYVLKAAEIDSSAADYFYAKALYFGRRVEISPVKEKARLTKEINLLLDKVLEIDPNHVKAIYTLANWNEEVSSLNPAIKSAMKVIFGGLPAASKENAIELYQKARKLNPGFIANNYKLSLLLKKTNKPNQAMEILQAQMGLPTKTKEEFELKNKSRDLLQSFQ